jgi:hypothetical protein
LHILIYLALTFITTTNSLARTYDLATDWSDVNNPNGDWSLYKAPGQLFTIVQPDWYSNATDQSAWADEPFEANAHVPMWAKAIGDVGILSGQSMYDDFVDPGTVFMHSAESLRTGTDFSTVVWTSPHSGAVQIDGGLWISKAFDRPHTWELRHNGVSFTSGSLNQADPYSQTNPFKFGAGSGGLSAVEFAVSAGDEIELAIYRPLFTFVPGTFVGLNLQIELVPEPTTMITATGLTILTILCRRTKNSNRDQTEVLKIYLSKAPS